MPRAFKAKDLRHLLEKQAQSSGPREKGRAPAPTHPLAKTLSQVLQHGRRIREKKMNKTEQAFSEILEKARQKGEILKWHFEEITLKIAPNTRYTPDFIAVLPSGAWHVFEIKGHLEDDASVKFKSAAQKFPEISFQMLRRKKGAWETVFKIPAANSLPLLPLDCPNTPKKSERPKTLTKGTPTKKKQT